MRSYSRMPNYSVEILNPNYDSPNYEPETRVIFGHTGGAKVSNDLTSYSFSESIQDPSAPFYLSLVPRADESGKTWMDKIQLRDIVYISEFGKIRYAGIVNSKRYGAKMTDSGPQRDISISGIGLGGLITSMKLILDVKLFPSAGSSKSVADKLMTRLSQKMTPGEPLSKVIGEVIDSFFEMVRAMGMEFDAGFGLKTVIDELMDFQSKLSTDVVFKYPVAMSVYQANEQDLWTILSNMITPPIHEIFGRWNWDTGKWELVVRDTPFDPSDWGNLKKSVVDPLVLKNLDLGNSDADLYTFFMSLLPGSKIGRNEALVLPEYRRSAEVVEKKWSKYGYRPFFVEFWYFDKDKIGTDNSVEGLMEEYSEKVRLWFENNAEFLSGTVTIMTTDDKKIMGYPRVGEKLEMLGGEFYIESAQHSYHYLGNMETTFQVSRGFIYDEGKMIGPIENIGQRIEQ